MCKALVRGVGITAQSGARAGVAQGRAVQVDPIKTELKARLVSALETKM
jgi:hypothetical protein